MDNDHAGETAVTTAGGPNDLDSMSDDALRRLIGDAETILKKREEASKREAEKQIREIAEAHGLKVKVEPAVRKRRGRKPKSTADISD